MKEPHRALCVSGLHILCVAAAKSAISLYLIVIWQQRLLQQCAAALQLTCLGFKRQSERSMMSIQVHDAIAAQILCSGHILALQHAACSSSEVS